MAGSSTSLVQVSYAPELELGVVDPNAKTRELSVTGETLTFALEKQTSNELNRFRGSSSAVAVTAEASGGVTGEVKYGHYDELIASCMQSPWVEHGPAIVEVTVAPTTITAAAPTTGSNAFTLLKAGQWFSLPGAVINKNKLFRVHPTTAPSSTVITLDPGTPGLPEADVEVSVSNSRLRNGVTLSSFSFQRAVTDANEFFLYKGMTPGQMTLAIATGSLSTIDFTFMGTGSERDNSTLLPTDTVDMPQHQIMSGVQAAVCQLWYGGEPLTGAFTNSINLSYDNALRMQNAVCNFGAIGIGSGSIVLTVDLEVYFQSGATFYDEFLKNEDKELAFTAFDNQGNGYVFTLPKANVTTYTVNAGAKDQDLMATITLTGLLDMTNADPSLRGALLFIDRMGVPVVFD